MKFEDFGQLKKQVKKGNIEGLKEVISDLTLKQAQYIEDIMLDMELTDEMNEVLDKVVNHIDSLAKADKSSKKVANKKAPAKEAPAKEAPAKTKKATKKVKLFDKVEVGDVVKFRVEGEEVKHDILIVYKGVNNLIGVMANDEREVFLIRKGDINKGIFNWTDRHGEQYNILITL
jgi:hypothetical protein